LDKQTPFGKLFWSIAVVLMAILGLFWSIKVSISSILLEALTCEDPQSAKKTVRSSVSFGALFDLCE